jgi:cytochrome oxidase Cu insertion factor (SCO1/SenC/PrrC family)
VNTCRICRLAITCGLILCLGCGGTNEPQPAASSSVVETKGTGLAAPSFTLTSEAGESFSSDQLAGKIWIANLIFTRCTATCPIQTANLARLQQSLAKAPGAENVRLVSISVDPEFDQPDVLREYAARYHADTQTWKFLTGARGAIYSLSRDGFKLPVNPSGDTGPGLVSHSPRFVLVDQAGKIAGYYDGTDQRALASLETKVREMLTETVATAPASETPAAPTIVYFPKGVEKTNIDQRRAAQLATRGQFKVYHDFGFTDVQPQSGIDFLHRIVDDAGKKYKGVHYDHGNGLAVADVDGDGQLDVYLVSQLGPNGLFHNGGDGKFTDITQKAGVALDGSIHVSASFADIDNDGDSDLYVTNVRSPNVLFENNGDGTFKDISADSGLAHNEHSSSAEFFDYNRDGLLDVFLTVVGQYTTDEVVEVSGTVNAERLPGRPRTYYDGFADAFSGHLKPDRTRRKRLYRNDGGNHFSDVTQPVGLLIASWSGDATPTDFNADGWPDLYVLNMQGHDEYWINENGQRFVRKSREVFPKTPWGAMGVKSFDFDNDGDMDLMLTDMHSDMSKVIGFEQEKLKASWINENWPESFLHSEGNSIFGNAFYRNKGDGTFEEVSDALNTETYWPWGLSVGDLNADGWQDVFITSGMNYPYEYLPNSVLINNAGEKFLDAEYILGVEPRRDGRIVKPWFQLACGGADKDHPLCKDQSGNVIVSGPLASRSSAIFDIDNDGDLDIVTNEFGDVPMLLASNLREKLGDRLHFLKIKLVGTKSNRDALGARVTVTAGGRRWLQVNDGQSGYLSQSSLPLYFGLGDAQQIDRIDVAWPSGQTTTVEQGLKINDLIEITEPAQ